jgi:hypothetical protein
VRLLAVLPALLLPLVAQQLHPLHLLLLPQRHQLGHHCHHHHPLLLLLAGLQAAH